MDNNRANVLLKACFDLLNKQKESNYVLNILIQDVFYDGSYCDGYCLCDDIEQYLVECNFLTE